MLFDREPRVFKVCYNLMKMMEVNRKYNFTERNCKDWMSFKSKNRKGAVTNFYNELNRNVFLRVEHITDIYEEDFAVLKRELRSYNVKLYQGIFFFKTKYYNGSD